MLIEIEIAIKVANDGKVNTTTIDFNDNQKVQHAITALQMAYEGLMQKTSDYLKRQKVEKKDIPSVLESLTFGEICNQTDKSVKSD